MLIADRRLVHACITALDGEPHLADVLCVAAVVVLNRTHIGEALQLPPWQRVDALLRAHGRPFVRRDRGAGQPPVFEIRGGSGRPKQERRRWPLSRFRFVRPAR